MTLERILAYDTIVIQCHDVPDADAIVSGYALLKYLESQGKSPGWSTAEGGRPLKRACV